MNRLASALQPFLWQVYYTQLLIAGFAAAACSWRCQLIAIMSQILILICSDMTKNFIKKSVLLAASFLMVPADLFVGQHAALLAFLVLEFFYSGVVFKHAKK